MKYQVYKDLPTTAVDSLIELASRVTFKDSYGHRCRMGANGAANLSVYENSKWFDWNRKDRAQFKAAFPEQQLTPAIIGYFLRIPKGGHLDKQTVWVDRDKCGSMVVVALQDQTFWIEGHELKMTKGQSIGFHLSKVHEIKPAEDGQLWACLMVMGDVAQLK